MSDDVTVSREKLREMLADIYCSGFGHEHLGRPECKGAQAADRAIAALTAPPPPPTLREQVAKAWCAEVYGEYSGSAKNPSPDHLDAADAVLAVVADAPIEQLIALVGPRFADWLAAQPLPPVGGNFRPAYVDQRDHDLRLLRGGSDV